ncbi:Amidohydrolase [Pricia antarctica]|uniref:Amidohydrolase n=1 Tax=Pricia antarctica TaxID=641691 RepID=A0A1G7HX20_9FLAO|nr:amidohydrolase family protein [Pricia antarctica]SDF04639.1 Amidohydrolase [Pricia antarctica]
MGLLVLIGMKIDAHVHCNSTRNDLLEYGIENDIRFISIITDVPEFPSIEDQLKTVVGLKKNYGNHLNFAISFSCQGWESKKWLEKSLDTIQKSLDMGAVGVKVWKNIGMSLTDENARYVMLDHPSFEPIFNYLEDNDVVLLGHNGEPKNCWLPIDEMTVESDRKYFSAHPEYYMNLHPEIPDYKAQLEARNNVLKRHPKLRFVGLHLASLEYDVKEVAAWLDSFPLTMVDLAERIVHIQHQAVTNWQKVHDFFMQYQNRIIYGTDLITDDATRNHELEAYLDKRYKMDWDFFANEQSITVPEIKGTFKGLGLPPTILQKIFHANAKRTYKI